MPIGERSIVLLGSGNALNFSVSNSVGSYIYLVMAEMIHLTAVILETNCAELETPVDHSSLQVDVAQRWLSHFQL